MAIARDEGRVFGEGDVDFCVDGLAVGNGDKGECPFGSTGEDAEGSVDIAIYFRGFSNERHHAVDFVYVL